jgi:hypothetical protein
MFVAIMDQSYKRVLILSVIYGMLIFIPAFLGVLISFTAQPGGISQSNAFIAPFLGPWAQTLQPNPHASLNWGRRATLCTFDYSRAGL